MVYHFLLCFTTLIFDLFASIRLAPDENDLQIALLRQQLRVLERKIKKEPRLSRPEKLMLVALTTRLQRQTQSRRERLREVVLLVQPETVLKWHRELVRRKWTFRRANHGGRPKLDCEIEALMLRIAREKSRMGYDKVQGELLKLGFIVSCPRPNAVGVRGGRF
jgi:hypothetical protein